MKTRIMFLRDSYGDNKSNPCGCLAISLVPSRALTNNIHYQVSILNPVDKFNRAVARQLARGRLQELPLVITGVDQGASMNDITELVMSAVATNEKLPKRARRAAISWLESTEEDTITITRDLSH